MIVSQKCIDLIRQFEGFSSTPYRCPSGIPTIGFGSTRDTDGKPITMTHPAITELEATSIMLSTLKTYEDAVSRYVMVPLNQCQFDALVSFSYNAGCNSLKTSTLLRKLNCADYKGASEQFGVWIYGTNPTTGVHTKLQGLVKRRQAEKDLFLS